VMRFFEDDVVWPSLIGLRLCRRTVRKGSAFPWAPIQ
jgi:hypothetical protein